MNFNIKALSLLLAGSAVALTGCKDSALDGGNDLNVDDGPYVHIAAAINLPSAPGSRSGTDEPQFNEDGTPKDDNDLTNSDVNDENTTDFEYGWNYEDNVRTMMLVFADKNNKYITHSTVAGISILATTAKPYTFVVNGEIKHSDLEKAYAGDNPLLKEGNNTVNVYAFCNYTSRMLNRFDALAKTDLTHKDRTEWINWEGEVFEEPSQAGESPLINNTIWSKNSFLMTNASKAEMVFPATIEGWDNYADKNHPYVLNASSTEDDHDVELEKYKPIHVERVASRIDFKDGSPDETAPNTYPIKIDTSGDGKGDLNLVSVRLNRLCLVNMSNRYYYLRRVSTDGLNTNAVVGGTEYPASAGKDKTRFVVDFDADDKLAGDINAGNAPQYFNFPLYKSDGKSYNFEESAEGLTVTGWFVDKIEDIIGDDANTDHDNWNTTTPGGGEYHIWRYVTENTIPASEADLDVEAKVGQHQKTVQSTGIIFKGSIELGADALPADKDVTTATEGDEQLYESVCQANKNVADNMSFEVWSALKNVAENKDKSPALYQYNNELYAGPIELIERANTDGNNGPLYSVVNKMLSEWKLSSDGKTYKYKGGDAAGAADDPSAAAEETLTVDIAYQIIHHADDNNKGQYKNFELDFYDKATGSLKDPDNHLMKEAPNAKITVYEAAREFDGDQWGFYCYYFYWNRHNDNSKSGLMGPMEFATVRNNVYKLAVTGINQLGHPRNTEHDPDPVEPDDPDEDPINYMQVQIDVLPWVVRVNNIEF